MSESEWDYLFSRCKVWHLTTDDVLHVELDSEVGVRFDYKSLTMLLDECTVDVIPIETAKGFKWFDTARGTVKEGEPKKMFIDYLRNKSQRY